MRFHAFLKKKKTGKLVPSLPCRNKNLVLMLKKKKKSGIELLIESPTLLDFVNFSKFYLIDVYSILETDNLRYWKYCGIVAYVGNMYLLNLCMLLNKTFGKTLCESTVSKYLKLAVLFNCNANIFGCNCNHNLQKCFSFIFGWWFR